MPLLTRSSLGGPRCCIFDLVGTLFWSPLFEQATHTNAIRCVADTVRLPHEQARLALDGRRIQLSTQAGFTVALSAAVCSFGIDVDTWQEYQQNVDVTALVATDDVVAAMLRDLRMKYALGLYTNMCRTLALRVLDHLRISDVWTFVVTLQEARSPKPAPHFVELLLPTIPAHATEIMSIGDRADVDLLPFTAIGASGYLVKDRRDLIALLSQLRDRGGM